MSDTIGVKLETNPASEFERHLLALLSHHGPVRYDDSGVSLMEQAAKDVWDSYTDEQRAYLANESAKFIVGALKQP